MGNDKLTGIRDYIVKNSKFVFPVILIAAVAVTVSIALNVGSKNQEEKEPDIPVAVTPVPDIAEVEPEEPASKEVPLTANENEAIYTLVANYYNAMSWGDSVTMTALYDEVPENDLLRYEEMSKYLDRIAAMDVYTKPGLTEGTTVVYVYYRLCFQNHEEEIPGWQTFYVCEDGQGGLYIRNEDNFTEEEKEYVVAVSAQDDVVELNNRVAVEYNELVTANPEILAYMGELGKQVNATIGVRLAEQNAPTEAGGENPAEGQSSPEQNPAEGQSSPEQTPEEGQESPEQNEAASVPEQTEGLPAQEPEAPAESGSQYASATTTVNVRSSDSEQADKLGKVVSGTKVQVQEVRVNGWTKIVFEGKDGYIKSEYLQMEESGEGQQTIGTVTAVENVRVRAGASEDAEQIGLLAGGESVELIANENGWCKVKYDGKVGYVKADYVTQ